jgi:ATP-dependent Clp protease ATP-binding subunit ClpA
MAVKSSRDELHKLFQQRTGFTEAPIDYTKYSNKQVSTSRQLSARQQQDEYRIAMRRLGYEFSTDSTYKPEDGEERLSPSYTFTTGQQREAQTSIKELMEKYRQQDEYRKESRELQPLDRTALMPKDTAGLSPEILRSEVASGVRDWQAYDLAKKELDAKYPDRIYRPEEPKPIINAKVPKPQELKSKIDSAMTDTATGKTKEVVKEEVMKIFGIPIKPIWKVTTQDLKNDAQYMGASVTREVGRVAGALTPQAIANSAFLLSSYTANAPYNFLASKFGWKKLENKTLTKAITDVVQSAGGS